MAAKTFVGGAKAVAKVYTITVGGTLAGETFTISVNGKVMATHTDADTVIATAVAALVSTWNAETHPWAMAVTATDASPDIVLTADTAGADFVVTVNTPGGSATFSLVETTANAGPNDWRSGDNWIDPSDGSIGTVPVSTDDITIAANAPNICFGLDQSAVTANSLTTFASWTGKIGLDYEFFATSADGDTVVPTAPEYRDTHLKIKVDGDVILGKHQAGNTPTGSGRINLDLDTQAAQVDVQFCALTSSEPGRPSVRLKANSSSTDIHVRDTVLGAGCGIAMDEPGDTSTVGDIYNFGGVVYTSDGVTMTLFETSGVAVSEVDAAATVPTMTINGTGTLVTEGDYTITLIDIDGPTVYCNNVKTAGSAITVANVDDGTLDGTQSSRGRTWDEVNHRVSATITYDDSIVTIISKNPKGGPQGAG